MLSEAPHQRNSSTGTYSAAHPHKLSLGAEEGSTQHCSHGSCREASTTRSLYQTAPAVEARLEVQAVREGGHNDGGHLRVHAL